MAGTQGWNNKPEYTDPNGIPYGETEMALLRLHANLIDFYSKHNPKKVNEDTLTILMQFFIDAGGVALNKKLMKKYGEDLQTFKRLEEPPPPALDEDTMNRIRRQSQRAQMRDMPMDLPPPPKIETTVRSSLESRISNPVTFDHRPRKKKIKDPEYLKFQKEKAKELEDLENDLFGPDDDLVPEKQPSEDRSLKLYLLDFPNMDPLENRDYIEAFYSKYDPSKLDDEAAIEKFVLWVEENSMGELSQKLKAKYGEGLFDMERVARRRRNLENYLTGFYNKFDKPKLGSRITILKILDWTIANGIPELNKKFMTRYGFPVIDTTEELDI